MKPKYTSQADAARRLGISAQRVSQLVENGQIKSQDVAGRRVIAEAELERFAALTRAGGRPRSNG